jgi:Prokaryotic phospholipase A2
MPRRRSFATLAATLLISLLGLLGVAQPAVAAPPDKIPVLSSWTQTSSSSYSAWLSARYDQGAWAAYGFDWSTDYCSSSPDNPLGFNFTLSCARHDFGYRNWKAVGQFPANKGRVDSAFYEDLKRKCATYSSIVRPACYSLAWTYYQAVRAFGSVITTRADFDRARALLPAGTVR